VVSFQGGVVLTRAKGAAERRDMPPGQIQPGIQGAIHDPIPLPGKASPFQPIDRKLVCRTYLSFLSTWPKVSVL
jgi:hypothetical protein